MQLTQLLLVDGRWRLRQQALRTLRFREGNDVAYGFSAGHHGYQPIKAEGHAAMRRRSVLQSIEQEAELIARFFRADIQRTEHFALNLGAVNTNRASAHFPTVQNHVVRSEEHTSELQSLMRISY